MKNVHRRSFRILWFLAIGVCLAGTLFLQRRIKAEEEDEFYNNRILEPELYGGVCGMSCAPKIPYTDSGDGFNPMLKMEFTMYADDPDSGIRRTNSYFVYETYWDAKFVRDYLCFDIALIDKENWEVYSNLAILADAIRAYIVQYGDTESHYYERIEDLERMAGFAERCWRLWSEAYSDLADKSDMDDLEKDDYRYSIDFLKKICKAFNTEIAMECPDFDEITGRYSSWRSLAGR